MSRFRVIALDELEAVPVGGADWKLTWRPVRFTLGLTAFGTNAYTAERPGQHVVEPHTEQGHEELYFVARGRATFTLDGEAFDAPAGTYVFVAEPSVRRAAVAVEAGTTVLSFGGPPGSIEPSAWEWYFRASPLRRSDPERARAILDDGVRAHPESPGMRYELACVAAVHGERDEALLRLREAIERRPSFAAAARDDEDFADLRDDPEFQALTSR